MRTAFRKSPLKMLRRMQPAKAEVIKSAIERIAADPSARNNNLKSLEGIPNGFRLRVGDWRVSFVLDREADMLEVFEIETRGDAYRW